MTGAMIARVVHGRAEVLADDPLHARTPPGPWQYAVSYPLSSAPFTGFADRGREFVTVVDIETIGGRVGIGWATPAGEFIEERYLDPGRKTVRLRVPAGTRADRLVIRNADRLEPSEFRIHALDAIDGEGGPLYQVRLTARDVAAEPVSDDGAVIFDDEGARAINAARMAWLDASGLPLAGRTVLDVGCGPGHFARYYAGRGCRVVGIDGRAENIRELRARVPQAQGHVGDVQRFALAALGTFEVVHCFGLLYHLDSPAAALRQMHDACGDLLVLETMVCDSSRPLVVLADESMSSNQALAGIGCRPSPTYVTFALNRVGFRFVYGTTAPPPHPDFLFEWRDNLDVQRDGHNLRCIFVASRRPLSAPGLAPLLDQ